LTRFNSLFDLSVGDALHGGSRDTRMGVEEVVDHFQNTIYNDFEKKGQSKGVLEGD